MKTNNPLLRFGVALFASAVVAISAVACSGDSPDSSKNSSVSVRVIVVTDYTKLKDGDLISSPYHHNVFVVRQVDDKWFKRPILNPEVFRGYGWRWEDIRTVSSDALRSLTTSRLVREVSLDGVPVNDEVWYQYRITEDRGSVHLVVGGEYDPDSVFSVNKAEMDAYEMGDPVALNRNE